MALHVGERKALVSSSFYEDTDLITASPPLGPQGQGQGSCTYNFLEVKGCEVKSAVLDLPFSPDSSTEHLTKIMDVGTDGKTGA